MNKLGVSKIDERLPIEKINRSKVDGFIKYFNQRQGHFEDVFGVDFSEQTAKDEFKKTEQLFWNE